MPTTPYRAPAGYYQADNTNYPQRQSAIGGIVDLVGNPAGVGSNMMGDPYTDEEIAAAASAPLMRAPGVPLAPMRMGTQTSSAAPSVTTLQPGRTTPFSRADAQALAALDPRALDEAKALAVLPESTPAKMTGSFGGKSFEMQPSARVDRNALARLYAQAQERKGQERQDSVRAQEQAGKLAIVEAPGKQLTERAKLDNDAKVKIAEMEAELKRPLNEAEIAKINAQTAASTGAETRAQAEAARQPQQQQQAAIDAALAEAQASPFAQTPEGRARIAALAKQSTVGKVVPEAAASAAGPQRSVSEVGAEMIADPIVAAALKRARDLKAGHWSGSQGRRDSAAASALLQRAVEDFARRNGVDPMELRPFLALGG